MARVPRPRLPSRHGGSGRGGGVPLPPRGPAALQQPGRRARPPRRLGVREGQEGAAPRACLSRGLRGVQRDRVRARPRHPARRRPGQGRHADRPRGRGAGGGRPLALHDPGHERGRALRARPPRGGPRDERPASLLPDEVRAHRPAPARGHRAGRQQRRGGIRQGARRHP
jgi:hypothetical protein